MSCFQFSFLIYQRGYTLLVLSFLGNVPIEPLVIFCIRCQAQFHLCLGFPDSIPAHSDRACLFPGQILCRSLTLIGKSPRKKKKKDSFKQQKWNLIWFYILKILIFSIISLWFSTFLLRMHEFLFVNLQTTIYKIGKMCFYP